MYGSSPNTRAPCLFVSDLWGRPHPRLSESQNSFPFQWICGVLRYLWAIPATPIIGWPLSREITCIAGTFWFTGVFGWGAESWIIASAVGCVTFHLAFDPFLPMRRNSRVLVGRQRHSWSYPDKWTRPGCVLHATLLLLWVLKHETPQITRGTAVAWNGFLVCSWFRSRGRNLNLLPKQSNFSKGILFVSRCSAPGCPSGCRSAGPNLCRLVTGKAKALFFMFCKLTWFNGQPETS